MLKNLAKYLNPGILGLIVLVSGITFATVLFYPFSLIFSGQWKLNQEIELFNISEINLFGLELSIGVITIRFYAICILLGLLAGYSLAIYLAGRHKLAGTVIDRLFIGLVVFGLIGARLFFVLFNLDQFSDNPLNIVLENARGGLAVFGMITTGLVYLWLYCRKFKFNLYEILDILAPAVLLGQVIGRFGNFFNYESYGGPTSVYWKMYVPPTANIYQDFNQKYFHPTFLYEIILNFFLLVFILLNYEKFTQKRAGLIFATYAFGYGIIRAFTELFRLDSLKIIFSKPLNINLGPYSFVFEAILVSQVMALGLAIVGIYVYFTRKNIIFNKKTTAEIST